MTRIRYSPADTPQQAHANRALPLPDAPRDEHAQIGEARGIMPRPQGPWRSDGANGENRLPDLVLAKREAKDKFAPGDWVAKTMGDARYEGEVKATYTDGKGNSRIVVEVWPQGFQYIGAKSQLSRAPRPLPPAPAPAPAEAHGWQPMATAPKNGTEFLAYRFYKEILIYEIAHCADDGDTWLDWDGAMIHELQGWCKMPPLPPTPERAMA